MKYYIMSIFLLPNYIFGQKKINCRNIEERYLNSSILHKDKTLTKANVKLCLEKVQKKVKIEVINYGDWSEFKQSIDFKFIKINNNNFEPILDINKLDSFIIIERFNSKNKWNGGISNMLGIYSNDFSDYLKINQEYQSRFIDSYNIPLKNVEIYETMDSISEFSFNILTFKKNGSSINKFEMSKIINIYINNNLSKTLNYTYKDILSTKGVGLENFKIAEAEL